VRRLSKNDIDAMREQFRKHCWAQGISYYLDGYLQNLRKWVVYIDSTGRVFEGFDDREDGRNETQQQRYIFAMVFMDRPVYAPRRPPPPAVTPAHIGGTAVAGNVDLTISMASGSAQGGGAEPDTADLVLLRRVVAYRRDPMITLLIKGLGRLVTLDPGDDPLVGDSTRTLRLRQISEDSTTATFYAAIGRMGLMENAEVELNLAPFGVKQFRGPTFVPGEPPPLLKPAPDTIGLQNVYTNFANAKRRTFELAVLAGGNYGAHMPTYGPDLKVQSQAPRFAVNGYLTAVVNIPGAWFTVPGVPWHLRAPWQKASIGGFVGTNVVRGSFGDEIVSGVAVGHVLSDAGLAAGIDWAPAQIIKDGAIATERQRRLLVGLDLRF
jgi:hypothetical protein